MDRGIGAAAGLPGSDRKDLAIEALAGSATVSDFAARHGVSRKFVYQQTHKARAALDDAFSSAPPDGEVLFELAVTKAALSTCRTEVAMACGKGGGSQLRCGGDAARCSPPARAGSRHRRRRSGTRAAGR